MPKKRIAPRLEIASLKEIGGVLRTARERRKLALAEVAVHADVDATTYSRWETAETDGGCQKVASAAAFLGLSPNRLLLKSPIEVDDDLSEEEGHDLRRLLAELHVMRELCAGSKQSPIAIIANHLAAVNQAFSSENSVSMPQGTVIQHDKSGAAMLYEPLPNSKNSRASAIAEKGRAYVQKKIERKKSG